jgi:hypothetical protein
MIFVLGACVFPGGVLVCAHPSDGLICEQCRALIRGESLQRKFADERAGRLQGR